MKVRSLESLLFSRYFGFVMYHIYVTSEPSLLVESTDYDYKRSRDGSTKKHVNKGRDD